jgi:hypothetical protein
MTSNRTILLTQIIYKMFRIPAWSLENLTGCCWAATVRLWPSTGN